MHSCCRRALNVEELIQHLKEQLGELDFVHELEKAEAYENYYLDEGDAIFEQDQNHFPEEQGSPEFNRHPRSSRDGSIFFKKPEKY